MRQKILIKEVVPEEVNLMKRLQELEAKNQQLEKENQLQQNKIEELKQKERRRVQEQFQQKQLIKELEEMIDKLPENHQAQFEQMLSRIPCHLTQNSMKSVSQIMIMNSQINSQFLQYQQVYKEPQQGGELFLELFEAFFIFGVDRNLVEKFQCNHIILDNPKLLLQLYKERAYTNKLEQLDIIQAEYSIQNQQFPFGLKVEKIFDDDDLRDIISSKINFNRDFFVFNLSGKDFNQKSYKNMDLLNKINPSRQLYGYCLKLDDYFISAAGNDKWKFPKTLCFMTYFPFQSLFEQLLLQIANLLKVQRQILYQNTQDGLEIIKQLKPQLSNIIKQLSNLKFQDQKITIDLYSLCYKSQQKYLPNNVICYSHTLLYNVFYENMRPYTRMILQVFSFEQFIQIFSLILLEKKIILCCENIRMLTNIMFFLHHVIQPFIWLNPVIYSASELTMNLGPFEMPFILGINQKSSYLKTKPTFRQSRIKDVYIFDFNQNGKILSITQPQDSLYRPYNELIKLQNDYFKLDNIQKESFDNQKIDQFLIIINNYINSEILKKLLPPFDNDFISRDGQLNDLFFDEQSKRQIQSQNIKENTKEFLQQICETSYFRKYALNHYAQESVF